jgi:two-component system LytT family sensor kinase
MPGSRKKNHLADLRLITGIGALYLLLQGITLLRIYLQFKFDGYRPDLLSLIKDRGVAVVIAIIFIIIIVKTTRRFLMENISWRRIIAVHLLFAVLISLLWYSTFIAVSFFLCPTGDCTSTRQELLYWYLINFDKIFLVYLMTVSLTYTYYYVRRDGIHKVQKSRIENQLLQTRLKALKSQLHPHFLFNTLNSIASLIDIDNRRAQTMIADLGDLLRHVLDSRDIQLVTVQEEMNLLKKFIDIEKTRFSDDLEVSIEIDPAVYKAIVPSMLLQPIVENSIRHGYSRKTPHLRIDIRIRRRDERLILSVEDNGRGFARNGSNDIFSRGTGLRNTYERLQSIYNENYIFRVDNRRPGVRNYIEIPLQFEEQAITTVATASGPPGS